MERTLRSRKLRRSSTNAEQVLWYELRDRRLDGFKFRRQQPWGPFILDFFCWRRRLAIELDGGQHFDTAAEAYDRRRTAYLCRTGVRMLRFSNDLVFTEKEGVLEVIREALGHSF